MDDGSNANPLVAALADGQLAGYAALYDRLGRSLVRVAGVMLKSTTDAQDVVQDLFVDLVRYRSRLVLVEDLDAYVFAMLRHTVGRRLQRQRAEQLHLKQWAVDATPKRNCVLPDGLESALDSLPPEQREVITLKIDADLTFAQIGKILQISPNTAASRYRYAIDKLRKTLESNS